MNIKPAPDCFIPKWATLCGVKMNVIEAYCGKYNHKDRLPRGCGKRIALLRTKIFTSITNHRWAPK